MNTRLWRRTLLATCLASLSWESHVVWPWSGSVSAAEMSVAEWHLLQPPEGEVEFGKRTAPPPREGGEVMEEERTDRPPMYAGGMLMAEMGIGPEAARELVPTAMLLFLAIDSDKDKVISVEEIANSSKTLARLDRNGDGKITPEELRAVARTMGKVPNAKSGGEAKSADEQRTPNPGSPNSPEEMVAQLRQMDKDGDGFLSKEEVPERLARNFERIDADQDGKLSQEEIRRMVRLRMQREGQTQSEAPANKGRPERKGKGDK